MQYFWQSSILVMVLPLPMIEFQTPFISSYYIVKWSRPLVNRVGSKFTGCWLWKTSEINYCLLWICMNDCMGLSVNNDMVKQLSGTNMGPTCPHVGLINLAIRDTLMLMWCHPNDPCFAAYSCRKKILRKTEDTIHTHSNCDNLVCMYSSPNPLFWFTLC